MARFSGRRIKTFRISTRVVRGSLGARIGIMSPGIARPRRRPVRVRGVQQIVKPI